MASDPPVEQRSGANPSASAARSITVGSATRTIELVVPDDDGIQYVTKEIFNGLCYRPVPRIPPPHTVLDIGANVGLAAAYFRLVYPGAFIHCVEPDAAALNFLVQNSSRIGNCRVHNVGLYEGDCERVFYAASHTVISSIAKNPFAQATATRLQLRDAGRFVAELGVERFDLIKIDTEGAEVPIIRSLAGVIRNAAIVHVEFHNRGDRRAIDDLMNPSHCLCRGVIESAHRGQFTYVANALVTHELSEAPLSLDG